MKGARRPAWIEDKDNQKKWNRRFIDILKRDYKNADAVISAILSDERLSQLCATRIRFYLDKGITLFLNEQRKARGVHHKKKLEIAIAGLKEAIDLCKNRGNQEPVQQLVTLRDDFSQALVRCKKTFATKRHGRDRAHSILFECRSFLERKLRHSVTNATLANLVTAGYEADGNLPKNPISDEQIRKNLAHFERNNPFWRNAIDPRFKQLLDALETK